jgi:hypothetical protein
MESLFIEGGKKNDYLRDWGHRELRTMRILT